MRAARRAGRVPAAALLAAAMVLPAAGPAAADGEKVRLPVMPARLDAGDPCTGGSKARATAVPWEQQNLQLARTWTFGRGAGVKVAVVDTGVSAQAPTLAGRVSAVGSAGADCVGHGTFVAGLIAAAPAKNVRVAGVAQESRIIAVRGTDERGAATAASVAAGIRAATDAGAKVVQVSPALAADSAGLASAVKYAAAHDALIVAAATPTRRVRRRAGSPSRRATTGPHRPPGSSPSSTWTRGAPARTAHRPPVARTSPPPVTGSWAWVRAGRGTSSGRGVVRRRVRGGHGRAGAVGASELSAAQTAQRLTRTAYPADVPRLDPYAAVTSVPDPVKRTEAVRDDSVVMPPGNGSGGATRRAVWIAVGGGSLALLVAWAALVAPRGRARGWRPAGRRPVAGTTGD